MEPLLPKHKVSPKGGRPRVADRDCLRGIIFMLRTGIPWEYLPQELGCGSGVTCWRRLRDWQRAGVWERLHAVMLDHLARADKLDWSRAALDSRSLAARKGGSFSGPNPTDKGKAGSKQRVLVERSGVPLAVDLTAANLNDHLLLEWMLDLVRPVANGRCGCPRHRSGELHADKAYDHRVCRQSLRARGILCRIARRGVDSSQRLGRHRWVVERTLAWLTQFRRLVIRYERRDDIHLAFMILGCTLISHRLLGTGQ